MGLYGFKRNVVIVAGVGIWTTGIGSTIAGYLKRNPNLLGEFVLDLYLGLIDSCAGLLAKQEKCEYLCVELILSYFLISFM